MPSAAEAKSAIESAFQTYLAELQQVAPVWDRKPAAGEGEDAWCARQVAEHIAGSGPFFGAGLAGAISVAGPTPARIELPDPSASVAETQRCHGLLMDVVNKIDDSHMGIEIDHPRLGKQTVAGILGILSYHLNDHANQLKTLRTT